jgi:hypothetical protein
MALTTCPDCGNQISTVAVASPKCGRPGLTRATPGDVAGQERIRMAQDLLRRWGSLSDQARANLACEFIKAPNPNTLDGGRLHYLVSKLAASGTLKRNLSRTTAGLLALFLDCSVCIASIWGGLERALPTWA